MIHAIAAAALSAHLLAQSPAALPSLRASHPAAQAQSGGAAAPALNFDVYRAEVEPLFLMKRQGNARCVDCHAPGAGNLRLQVLAPGAYTWTEEQSRRNFEKPETAACAMLATPRSQAASMKLLTNAPQSTAP